MVLPTNSRDRQSELDKIADLQELIDFAISNSSVHKVFNHYTTIDGLLGMIENKLLRLSNGKNMNDIQETTKGKEEVWSRTYISSFSYGDNENIAMWSIYSIPWENGIRISIPGNILREWISEIETVYSLNENNEILNEIEIKSIHLTDVLYSTYDKKDKTEKIKLDSYKIINSNEKFNNSNPSLEGCVTGFIKNKAWEYENETRIRIETVNRTGIKKIALKIPDYVIDSFEITTSPWFINELKLDQVKNKFDVSQSIFKDLVKLKTLCDSCKSIYQEKSIYHKY